MKIAIIMPGRWIAGISLCALLLALPLPASGRPSSSEGARRRFQYQDVTQPQWTMRDCPCNDTALCQQVSASVHKEVFIFSLNKQNWLHYDWDRVTTIVEVGYHDDDLVCFAHSKNARVVMIANIAVTSLPNATARHEWILEKVQYAKENFLDGINVDFEDNIPTDSPEERQGLTDLMTELQTAFHSAFKNTQVSIDVAWSPDCIDQRCYDYAPIIAAVDLAFIMAYDERSQIFYKCSAWANSAHNTTLSGIERYIKLGASPQKLILGLPWYGYDYPCTKYNHESHVCEIKEVPFRGVNCSDAAGSQVDIAHIMKKLAQSFTGRMWDKEAQSPYFSFYDEHKTIHQMWYDDPLSLSLKIHLLDVYSLRGTGMWEADDVDYSDTTEAQQVRQSMWQTLSKRKSLNEI